MGAGVGVEGNAHVDAVGAVGEGGDSVGLQPERGGLQVGALRDAERGVELADVFQLGDLGQPGDADLDVGGLGGGCVRAAGAEPQAVAGVQAVVAAQRECVAARGFALVAQYLHADEGTRAAV